MSGVFIQGREKNPSFDIGVRMAAHISEGIKT